MVDWDWLDAVLMPVRVELVGYPENRWDISVWCSLPNVRKQGLPKRGSLTSDAWWVEVHAVWDKVDGINVSIVNETPRVCVVMDFSRLLESSTFLRWGAYWFLRCIIDEIVTALGFSDSPREVIFAAIVSGLSDVLLVPTWRIMSETSFVWSWSHQWPGYLHGCLC